MKESDYSLAYNCGLLKVAIMALHDVCWSGEDPRAEEWEKKTRAAHKAIMETWMEAHRACGQGDGVDAPKEQPRKKQLVVWECESCGATNQTDLSLGCTVSRLCAACDWTNSVSTPDDLEGGTVPVVNCADDTP
jgi:hypothetical protein